MSNLKIVNNHTFCFVGLLIVCVLFAVFFSSDVHALGIGDLHKAGGDLRDTVHKAGGDLRDTVHKAGTDTIEEVKRIPGNMSGARNDVVEAAEKARNDVIAELGRMPSNVEAHARANAEKYMASQLDQLRRAFPVQPDILEQQIKGAIANLIPGYAGIRLGIIAKNVAQAADKFRLANAHANNLVIKVQDWPRNNENLSPFCAGLQTNTAEMFAPFISGPEAEVMNLRASVIKISEPVRGMVNSICDVVNKGQDMVNQGKEIQDMTQNSVKTVILDEMNQKFRAAFQGVITDMVVAATSPF